MSDMGIETTSKVVWFELPADDTRRAQSVYGELFSWRFPDSEGNAFGLYQDVSR